MRARWLCLAALALPFAPLLCGCGGIGAGASNASDALGSDLTIYSSLPLHGPSAGISRQILAGERLALGDTGGRVGSLRIGLASLDDSSARSGSWDPGVTEANAKLVAHDPTAIAYLGDYDSGATAVSLPLTNAAGILQVSPGSPYAGLTSAKDAGEDEPDRFYPTAMRTFGRVAPGDPVQAGAQVALMRALHVGSVYVLSDVDPFDGPLAQLLASDARRAGIALRGQDTLDVPFAQGSFVGEIARIAATRPQAVFFSGLPTPGAASLFAQLHSALPRVRLLGSSALSNPAFLSRLGAAADVTLLGTPALPPAAYPPSAQGILRRCARRYRTTSSAYVLYGYEAMGVVLSAIRSSGARGDDRRAVVESFFGMRRPRSVLGPYSIQPSGEPTISRYGVEQVRAGVPSFWRAFSG